MFKKIFLLAFSFFFLFGIASFASAATCTSTKVTIIARDQDGKFIPNINFEIYEQVFDVDNKPKPGTKVAGGKTSAILGSGVVSFVPKLSEAEIAADTSKMYALKLWDKSSSLGEFWYYNELELTCDSEATVTNVLSGIRLAFYNADGDLLKNIKGSLYTQRYDLENNPIKEKQDLVGAFDTSSEGAAFFYLGGKQYDLDNNSSGLYMIEFKSASGIVFEKFGISIDDLKTNYINYIFGEARFVLKDASTDESLPNHKIEVYKQDYDSYNNNKLGVRIKEITTDSRGTAIFQYPESMVAVAVKNAKGVYEYFWQKEILDQRRVDYDLRLSSGILPETSSATTSSTATKTQTSAVPINLLGKILLQVEANGEAWYIHPDKKLRYYLKDGDAAFKMMRGFGLGISNADISKIPVGVDTRFNKDDADGDGLADFLEMALGTKPYQSDSDGDGYLDGEEIKTNHNPLGAGSVKIDQTLASKLKGKIVLQVQSKGEAWYINPADGKRYYMGNGQLAFEIMRFLSLGAKNSVIQTIMEGKL